MRKRGFTLVELLVVVAVIAILLAIIFPVIQRMRIANWRAVSTHSLRQLGASGAAYLADHNGEFWKYRESGRDGVTWWFGFESKASARSGEGDRVLDPMRGPLGPYAAAASGVKSDPAFTEFPKRHKPKFENGNHGYGYNAHLGGGALGRQPLMRLAMISRPSRIVMFATCAQVNTFQSPATSEKPLIEEFYLVDAYNTTVHFRYGGKALAAMVDGSIQELEMDETTLDARMPEAQIGRFAPLGDTKYLVEQEEE